MTEREIKRLEKARKDIAELEAKERKEKRRVQERERKEKKSKIADVVLEATDTKIGDFDIEKFGAYLNQYAAAIKKYMKQD